MELLAWGANTYGELGVGFKYDQVLNPINVKTDNFSPEDVKSIVAGASYTLILTKAGLVFACGGNTKCSRICDNFTFKQIKHLARHKIVQVSCGWDFSLALTDKGEVYAWGSNVYGQLGVSPDRKLLETPQLIENIKAKYISCGLRHTAIVTVDGKLVMSGNGTQGELGLVDGSEKLIPHAILAVVPDVQKVECVACGQHHTVVLTSGKGILGFGSNKFGQLGFDLSLILVEAPTRLEINEDVDSIHAGWTHTAILTRSGQVYNFGRNTYSELGTVRNLFWKPTLLDIEKIAQMSLGSEHNLALTPQNKIYVWGWNEHGNCGTGNDENVTTPIEILQDYDVIYVAAGTGQSFAVVKKKNV